jgi:GT2 family glycosyltransferase
VTPSASVVVCAYTERRWADLCAAVASVRAQVPRPTETVVVVDHNPALLARARRELPRVRCVPNDRRPGLSGARNSGIAVAPGEIVAFLDDDAEAEPGWLERLLDGYRDPRVMAVGGAVLPRWAAGRPPAFPPEFDWVVGCTYRGLPEAGGPVRNLIGANMSFRRAALDAVGGFREGIGRVGTVPVGCEETELCLRVHRRFPEGVVLYEPRAAVRHRVTPERASWRYFAARCYAEGRSKAEVCRLAGARAALSSERAHVVGAVRRAIARDVAHTVRTGDPAGFARAGVAAAGVLLAAAGVTVGRAGATVPRRGLAPDGGDDRWLRFSIHDRVGVRVAADAPAAPQLREMLAPFLVADCDRADLTIGRRSDTGAGPAGFNGHHAGERALELPAPRVRVGAGPGAELRLTGDGELLVPALALLDHLLVRREAAMVHAAAICRNGRGVCIAGAGGAGKTSAALSLALSRGDGFMADDWCFVAADGRLLGYAKPLFLRPHHRTLLPGSPIGRRAPSAPAALVRPLGAVATAVHPIASRWPRAARIARRWWPEYRIVAAADALQGATVVATAPLAAALFVERAPCAEAVLEARSAAWMADRLVGSFHAELPRGARDLQAELAGTGLLSLDRLFAGKSLVLRRALAGRPAFRLRLPDELRAHEAAETIAAAVDTVLDGAGS